MRGIDYRCGGSSSITEIIAAPFSNYREGLNRVGRFGDKCCRYLVAGVHLVDKDLEHAYNGNLAAFLNPPKTTLNYPKGTS